jgi:hypothetical protein
MPFEDSGALLCAVGSSNHTVASYSQSLDRALSQTYNIWERLLFSAPKLALFPALVGSHPRLVMTMLPVSIAVDAMKGSFVSLLTAQVETMAENIQVL